MAVLVNDFGTLPIDADLIAAQDGNLISIEGGCVCCSFGDDLVGAILELKQKDPSIEHFLIEASGVALPKPIAQTLTVVAGVQVNAIVTLADAENILGYAKDRYVSDTVCDQVVSADIVLLTKTDLVSLDQVIAIEKWVKEVAPSASVLATANGDVAPEVILGTSGHDPADFQGVAEVRQHQTLHYGTANFESEGVANVNALAASLAKSDYALLRVKGFVKGADGKRFLLNMVGRRTHIEPAPAWIDGGSRVVCIGLAPKFDKLAVRNLIGEHFHQ